MLKRNYKVSMLCVLLLSTALMGCGNAIPEMTEEESALITEYAAGLLLEYHADSQSRLVDTSQPLEEDKPDVLPEKEVQTATPISENSTQVSVESTSPQQDISTRASIAQVLAMTDFEITYTGYEVCDSYPNEQTSPDDMFFAMKAGEGNKLLVLKLRIANAKEQALTFNTLALHDVKCRVIADDRKYNALVTMLDNDFLTMEQNVNPGESMEAVVIAEISAENAEQLQSVRLYVQNGEKDTTVDCAQ